MADDLEDVLAGRAAKHAAGALASAAQDPLASLLDESTVPRAAPLTGAAAGAATVRTTSAGASTPVATGSRRRWLVPASAMLMLAVLAGGAFALWRRSFVQDPARPSSDPLVSQGAPRAATVNVPVAKAPVPPSPTASATAAPATATAGATTAVRAAATPAVPVVGPRSQVSPPASPSTEPPPVEVSDANEGAAATSSSEAARSRIRLSAEHPFENGRLIVWIDGVLVYETKLQATASKRIVAFKVREGHVETVLDVEPGPHEARVEVTWDQNRRVDTKLIDVASGSTGLLEVRVGRVSKDLSLSWSRLAKE
jgi:hypothetical protein